MNEVCAITGASGYVGSIITQELRQHMPVVALARNDWSEETLRTQNVKVLIHAAWDMQANSRQQLEKTCVTRSANLFSDAKRAGVERIIFISTISAFAGCRSAYGQAKLAVEKLLPAGVVLRLGLVFGDQPGGVFGNIRKQVQKSSILPLIGSGNVPQYLLHQQTLAQSVLRAVRGEFDHYSGPITLAHPHPWPFRDLVQTIAAQENRSVKLLPVPWPVLYAGVRTAEILRLRLPFRSDSIISFVNYDRQPDFSALAALKIDPIPFEAAK